MPKVADLAVAHAKQLAMDSKQPVVLVEETLVSLRSVIQVKVVLEVRPTFTC